MNRTVESKNKALVLEAFDTLFNKRDYAAAEKFWSPHYIQHSAHIAPGREGLFDLIKSLPPTLKYEHGTIAGEGDFVIVHGRFSNFGLCSAARSRPMRVPDKKQIRRIVLEEAQPHESGHCSWRSISRL
jgi:predicted SnoaL-like aldol condensation-catalyzing enzyme